MSHGPSTFGTMITSSLSPISVTSWIRSSSTHGLSSEFTRVHSAQSPKSVSFAALIRPSRAASFLSAAIASSRFPRRMSACCARSGALAAIFSFEKSRKWIIREGFTGISSGGSGASIASGCVNWRGFRTASFRVDGREIYRPAPEGYRRRSPETELDDTTYRFLASGDGTTAEGSERALIGSPQGLPRQPWRRCLSAPSGRWRAKTPTVLLPVPDAYRFPRFTATLLMSVTRLIPRRQRLALWRALRDTMQARLPSGWRRVPSAAISNRSIAWGRTGRTYA